ncbi:hypothetical protein ACFLSA_02825 [Bacteroidota bacterium]
MITDTQRRNQILKKIQRIPSDKLKELDDFVSKLEQNTGRKTDTLSYAGAWYDIDNSILDDLTKNLISKRMKNRPRIDE